MLTMRELVLPGFADAILSQLHACGFSAFVVGGCVRDALRGAPPSDWDVCTSALPSEVQASLCTFRIIETGLVHGTLTVLSDGNPVEVTTYRIDGAYRDLRRPESVTFTEDLTQDLARRDFTINAMAYSPDVGLVDPFHGTEDLAANLLRCVGDPDTRFSEDALRILRALRFSATLGFSIHPDTAMSILRNAENLKHIASERITAELCKLVLGDHAHAVLADFAPVFVPLGVTGTLPAHAPPILTVRLAHLLTPDAVSNFRLPNAIAHRIELLWEHRDTPLLDLRRLIGTLGRDATRELLLYRDVPASVWAAYTTAEPLCCRISELAVSGSDLRALGFSTGPAMGRCLQTLLDAVLDDKLPNERDALLQFAKDLK